MNVEMSKTPEREKITRISFYITYVILLTTGTLTLIEAISTNNAVIRHIMNIETCVSFVAAYFYSVFIKKIDENKSQSLPYDEITKMRYLDWAITTPLMLLALSLVMGFANNMKLKAGVYLLLLVLDMSMLGLGYLGETQNINKHIALVGGTLCMVGMFAILWWVFIHKSKSGPDAPAYSAFCIYIVLWSLYGIAYMQNTEDKNTIYNILDLCAKSFVGILFWMYLAKVLDF